MNQKKTICIDAGHGGSDPGAIANGMRESDITFEVSIILKGLLEQAGFNVILTRTEAFINPGINGRFQFANVNGADYFVSIHVNAGGGTGAETFYYTGKNDSAFARTVNDAYASTMGLRNRGLKHDTQTHVGSLGVLRHTTMPAILLELAFIDSPSTNPDVSLLRNARHAMAVAVCEGVCKHINVRVNVEPIALPTLNIDVLGTVKNIHGFIKDGESFVRLTEYSAALGYKAAWDEKRRIPVITK